MAVQAQRIAVTVAATLVLATYGPRTAEAATATGNLGVSITISSECKITTLGNLSFGTHGVLDADVAGTATLGIQCTNTTPYTVALDAGAGTGATVAVRLLSDVIEYSLFSDLGHTVVWGDNVGTDTIAGTGDGDAQSYTIYGLVPAQTTPAPNTYTDTVVVTVTY